MKILNLIIILSLSAFINIYSAENKDLSISKIMADAQLSIYNINDDLNPSNENSPLPKYYQDSGWTKSFESKVSENYSNQVLSQFKSIFKLEPVEPSIESKPLGEIIMGIIGYMLATKKLQDSPKLALITKIASASCVLKGIYNLPKIFQNQ